MNSDHYKALTTSVALWNEARRLEPCFTGRLKGVQGGEQSSPHVA